MIPECLVRMTNQSQNQDFIRAKVISRVPMRFPIEKMGRFAIYAVVQGRLSDRPLLVVGSVGLTVRGGKHEKTRTSQTRSYTYSGKAIWLDPFSDFDFRDFGAIEPHGQVVVLFLMPCG